jgi:hypothetical protein
MRSLIVAAILAGTASVTLAQTATPPSGTATTPSLSPSSETTPTTASGIGASAEMSAVELKLRNQGYTDIKLHPGSAAPAASGAVPATGSTAETASGSTSGSGSSSATIQPMWTGTAVKDGKTVNIAVDAEGKIHEQ